MFRILEKMEIKKKKKVNRASKAPAQTHWTDSHNVRDSKRPAVNGYKKKKKIQVGIKPDKSAGTPEHYLRQLWQKPHLHWVN